MKKLSIKLRITLWFTSFMILLCAGVYAFISIVSNSTSTRDVRLSLTHLVDKNAEKIKYEDGRLKIDDDFVFYRSGVYCLIFNENGTQLGGQAPYDALAEEPFEHGSVRTVITSGETYLIYDRQVVLKHKEDVWVRGIVSESRGYISAEALSGAALIALPLLILLASVGGYLLARRSLRPIQKISDTAREIGDSGNLAKRIDMGAGGDELCQLAAAFNRMFDRLEANFEAQRQFTSDASHELRTPVSVILAQCEYAFENASGEQELYESIGAIQKQGYRMSHLIELLLAFTRIEQKTEELTFEAVDLSALVRSVCGEQNNLGEKSISLTEDVQPDIWMKANPALFARMLINLIQNAYRYGRENGYVKVHLKETGDNISLSVEDDGIGIAAEDLPKIWNRFYQADKSRSFSKGSGLGLGLAMVRQIAELHGGSVSAESEPGKGSVFTIRFIKS